MNDPELPQLVVEAYGTVTAPGAPIDFDFTAQPPTEAAEQDD